MRFFRGFSYQHNNPQLIDQSESAHWFGYYIRCEGAFRKEQDLLLFKIPTQEAICLEICSICTFQVKFWSIYTPRYFVNSSCFIELLSKVKDGSLLNVFNLCLELANFLFNSNPIQTAQLSFRLKGHKSYFWKKGIFLIFLLQKFHSAELKKG